MTTAHREHWQSRTGFMLAALGSAVGLGNVWRFAYVAGEHGGAAFLLVYLVLVLLVGVPLLLGEFALGRQMQGECATAVAQLVPRTRWRHAGRLGVIAAGLILVYYAVIAGWVLKYAALYLLGGAPALAERGPAAAFAAHLAHPFEPLTWQALMLALAGGLTARGVTRGIERASVVLLPLLALLLLALALYSATLPGLTRGLRFLFQPDWSALTRPAVYLAAMGQAFFSIGLAMGVMITYGSYQPAGRPLGVAALAVAFGDALFAITAGLVIFPAVFSFGLDPAQGPGLAFVVLPTVFAQLEGGALLGAAFFLLLAIAALTSIVSLLEVLVAWSMQHQQLTRRHASLRYAGLGFALGIPVSLGFVPGLLPTGTPSLLDAMDLLAVDWLLPLNGLLLAVLLGWVWPRPQALQAAGLASQRIGELWHLALRYLAPLALLTILLGSLHTCAG